MDQRQFPLLMELQIGAVLDRNGLRPARYIITKGGVVVVASETGVINFAPEEIA